MPQSRWTLARVVVDDGVDDDGVNTVTTFRYEEGRYDRFEREFYGFGKVTEEHRDASNGDALYRSVITEYRTDSYYSRGLKSRELTVDATNHPFVEIAHSYEFVGIGGAPATQAELLLSPTATVFPQLARSDRRYFEDSLGPTKRTHSSTWNWRMTRSSGVVLGSWP